MFLRSELQDFEGETIALQSQLQFPVLQIQELSVNVQLA